MVLDDSLVLQDHELQVEDLELGAERYQKGRKGLKVCQFRHFIGSIARAFVPRAYLRSYCDTVIPGFISLMLSQPSPRRLVRDYKTKVFVELGAEFPTDPQARPLLLKNSAGAVWCSFPSFPVAQRRCSLLSLNDDSNLPPKA